MDRIMHQLAGAVDVPFRRPCNCCTRNPGRAVRQARRKGFAMGQAERERRHQAALEGINRLQLVEGQGDHARVDHEATLLERARLLAEEISAHQATEQGLQALDRLLRRAEEPGCLPRATIVLFLAALWSQQPLALATLRGLERETGDDMLAVLDAYRHGRVNLVEEVAGGPARLARVLAAQPQPLPVKPPAPA